MKIAERANIRELPRLVGWASLITVATVVYTLFAVQLSLSSFEIAPSGWIAYVASAIFLLLALRSVKALVQQKKMTRIARNSGVPRSQYLLPAIRVAVQFTHRVHILAGLVLGSVVGHLLITNGLVPQEKSSAYAWKLIQHLVFRTP